MRLMHRCGVLLSLCAVATMCLTNGCQVIIQRPGEANGGCQTMATGDCPTCGGAGHACAAPMEGSSCGGGMVTACGGSCPSCGGGICHACGGGCRGGCDGNGGCGCGDNLPKELSKVSLPEYVIEPPDILDLELVRGAPLPPYRLEPGDILQIQVPDALPNEPLSGIFLVEPNGAINLGLSYGAVQVAGMTVDEARAVIRRQLLRVLKEPRPIVTLYQTRGLAQTISGLHLVRVDGTVSLGVYGSVYVAGLNLRQARYAIEKHLSHYINRPLLSLDVSGFNSKVYYVVYDGGGYGMQIYRLPITGNETVLDALGLVNGLPAVSSTHRIWVARPSPCENGCDQVLPVDWKAVVEGGSTATNYQILPGDRIFVKADALISIDNWVAKFLSPLERLMGFALLTGATIQTFKISNGTGVGFVTPVVR
jgi:polysaccharide export outer membrane protein